MHAIVRWCLGNRAVVILFTLLLMGGGVVSIFRLNQELLPSVEFPAVFVLVPEPGAGPDQVDRDVTQPLIAGLTGLPQAEHVTTSSSQGFSQVEVQFSLDSTLKDDLDAVNQRLAQVQLPSTAGKPLVQTFDFNSVPTMTYSLAAGDGDLARATREADEVVVPALRGARGVAQVRVSGGARSSVTILLDGTRLAAHGVSLQQVQQALAGAQVDLPAGEVLQADRSVPVEALATLTTVDELRRLVVGAAPVPGPAGAGAVAARQPSVSAVGPAPSAAPAAPQPVVLGDVATITEGATPINGISRTDGRPSLDIQVIKASGGNAVTLSSDVRSRVAGLHLSEADDLRLVSDTADGIRSSLADLVLEGLLGALLAVAVIFLFLRSIRATLVTAVSLPTSVLVALLGTDLWGFSLNVLTLAGLTIAIGRIVDDAIVVLENGYRHLQQGRPPLEAAYRGATEVSSAVVSSTLTAVGVFLPIGMVGGIISRFFLPFSVTVTIALLASLLVAMTVVPVLVSFFLQSRAGRLSRADHRPNGLARAYAPALRWVLARGWRKASVVVVALALLAGAASTLARVPVNFFDSGGSTQLTGTVTLPAGTTSDETSRQLQSFETAAMADPGVSIVQTTVGSSDYGAYTAAASSNVARLRVVVRRKTEAAAVASRLRAALDRLYGAGSVQFGVASFGTPTTGFQATVSGTDPAALRRASDLVVARLQADHELANVRSDLAAEKPERLVAIDPTRAAAHGMSAQTVGLAVARALSAQNVGTLGPGGAPVTLLLDPSTVAGSRLSSLPLGPGTTLGDVATISDTLAPAVVDRQDGMRQVTVSADVTARDTQGATNRASSRLVGLELPSGVTLSSGSSNQDLTNSLFQMVVAIGVSVGIVFLILVAFFRSVVTPFVILTTMPLALIGGILALFAFHASLGLPALLGVLMVFGIVVSNAILLIDFVERNRTGRSLNEALVLAGSVRVRPILMTAVATIVALLPVAAGVSTAGGGGLISQSLALVVEGGLVSSTFLTLLVIPIVYSWLRRRAGGRMRLAGPRAEEAPDAA